jgi:hypothetical protein
MQEQHPMNSSSIPIVVFALVATSATFAQDKSPDPAQAPEKAKVPPLEPAIARAVALLIERQESLDPNVKATGEWPYEGVYRERFLERLFQLQEDDGAGTTASSRAAKPSARRWVCWR